MAEAMSLSGSLMWTRDVLVQWRAWTRRHWRMTLALSALAFVVGWVWNTYLMAVNLDGSQVGPGAETAATADGHTGNGLFWLLLFSLAGGLVTYAWSRGWRNFRADMLALPRRFGEAMASGRSLALAMLLWGAAVSLVISTIISSAVSLALGLVLVALATTPVGVILNFALVRAWRGLCGIITPAAGPRLAVMVSPVLVMVGEAVGLFADWAIGAWLVELVLGVACAVVSVLLVRGAPPPRAAVLLLASCVLIGWQVVRVRWAYADDGGWGECVTSDGEPCSDLGLGGIFAWLGSPGAGHVVARGSIGGLAAAIGAALGLGVGGAAASLAVAAAQAGAAGQAPGPRSAGDSQQWPAGPDQPQQSGYDQLRQSGPPPLHTAPGSGQAGAAPQPIQFELGRDGTVNQDALPPPQSTVEPPWTVPSQHQPDLSSINDLLPEPPDRDDDENEGPAPHRP